MRITILYDNDAMLEGLRTGWGFSCLIEKDDMRLLFDTGWDGDQLMDNCHQLGIDLRTVDAIFISHEHWDHIGGLARVLTLTRDPIIYLPSSLSKSLKREIASRARVVEISGPKDIDGGFLSTGTMGTGIDEQSLIIEEDDGITVLTGCAHQGLENILGFARKRGLIKVVMGGFHGFDELSLLDGIDRILPCHCTVHKSDILKKYPDNSEKCGAGKVIDI